MDEIDAALDFKNVSIISNYIKERTDNAQTICISLRSQMFENAFRLHGIYKTSDVTKTITIDPSKVAKTTLEKANNSISSEEQVSRTPLSTLKV